MNDEAPKPDAKKAKPEVPEKLSDKVRKVAGNSYELASVTEGQLAGKPTDFRWGMDRDLDKLTDLLTKVWIHDVNRLQAINGFKTIVWNLKRRADRSGYMLLSDVCLLFMDYLTEVPPADQGKPAIENYLDAIRVISKGNIIGKGGQVGDDMRNELTTLNSKAGVRVRGA